MVVNPNVNFLPADVIVDPAVVNFLDITCDMLPAVAPAFPCASFNADKNPLTFRSKYPTAVPKFADKIITSLLIIYTAYIDL